MTAYRALQTVAWALLLSVAVIALYSVLDPLKAEANLDLLSFAVSTALMFVGLGVMVGIALKGDRP